MLMHIQIIIVMMQIITHIIVVMHIIVMMHIGAYSYYNRSDADYYAYYYSASYCYGAY